jgi:uncharacterized membrane protein HdeD (DUF308 family)
VISIRFIGIVWVLAGLVLLLLAFRGEERDTPFMVIGVVSVALGAALVRRSGRKGERR